MYNERFLVDVIAPLQYNYDIIWKGIIKMYKG